MSSEDKTSAEHCPPRSPFKREDMWRFKSLSNDLPSVDNGAFKTPQATRCQATPSSRHCRSSARRPILLDTSESEDETSEPHCPPRTPSTREKDVRPVKSSSSALRTSGKSSIYSTPQASQCRSPSSRQCWSSARQPIVLDTSDSEDETSAQHWSPKTLSSRENDLQPFKAPSSALRTPPNKFCAFSTPQVARCLANLPPRQCWSSAKKRPAFLDDNSSSEEENKQPRDCEVSSKPIARTLFSSDDDAWFLESLSEDKPLEECHLRAVRFRRQFRKSRQDLTEALFTIFNKELFGNRLPRSDISWNGRLTSTAGRCFYLEQSRFRVELSPKLLDCAGRTRDTLLHELCHAAVWCIHGCRGGHSHSGWKFWVNRAARRFPKLPPIERCHNYKKGHTVV